MSSQAQVITLDILKPELGIDPSDTSQDARLTRYLHTAVQRFETAARREIPRTEHTARLGSRNSPRLWLQHAPVEQIDEVRYRETVVDPDTYTLEDAEAGTVRRTDRDTWASTEYIDGQSVEIRATADTPAPYWEIDYTGGWVTPYQVDNDQQLSTGDRTLPFDLEQALIDYAVLRYRWAGRDDTLSSKSVGDASASWNEQAGERLPGTFEAAVEAYRRPLRHD